MQHPWVAACRPKLDFQALPLQIKKLTARQAAQVWLQYCAMSADNAALREVRQGSPVPLKSDAKLVELGNHAAGCCQLADVAWDCMTQVTAGCCGAGKAAWIQLLQYGLQRCIWQVHQPVCRLLWLPWVYWVGLWKAAACLHTAVLLMLCKLEM
jgi:hypothetical protein